MSFLVVFACVLGQLWSVSGITPSLECSRSTGMKLTITDVLENEFHGRPYVQPQCFDDRCGQTGVWWTRAQVDFNVTYTYTVSMANLEAIDVCRTRENIDVGVKFTVPVIIPRLADAVELASDYLLFAECIMSDRAFISVPMDIDNIMPITQVLQTVRTTSEGASVSAAIVDTLTSTVPTAAIDIGDSLTLRVSFEDNLGIYTRLRVIDFIAYDPAGSGNFYEIVKEGCVTEMGDRLNANNQNNLAFPPALITFEAFRFAKNPRVSFNVTVQICQSNSPESCTFVCPTIGRKRRSADVFDSLMKTSQPQVQLQMEAIVNMPHRDETEADQILLSRDSGLEHLNFESEPLLRRVHAPSDEISRDSSEESRVSGVCLTYLQTFAIGGVLAATLVLATAVLVVFFCKIFVRRPSKNVQF